MSEHNEMMMAMRVLTHAINELNRTIHEQKASADPKPAKAGQPWSEEEDRLLMEGFVADIPKEELAEHLERNIGGINSRLELLGERKPVEQAKRSAAHLREAIEYHNAQKDAEQRRTRFGLPTETKIGDSI